jgi:SNF2 family DNA or RNA helicase
MKYKDDPVAFYGAMVGIHKYYGITENDCKWIMEHEEYTPFKNLDELWKRIGDNVIKVDRKDLFDLPPKIYKTYSVELTAEQKKLYLQLQNQYCTDHITVDNGLKLYLRFQDICNGYEPIDHGDTIDDNGKVQHNVELVPLASNPKLEALEEVMEEIGSQQVVVWCSRTQLLYDAEKRLRELGYTTGIYDGKIGTENREKSYNDFAEKKIQVIFINQASGAYGLDRLKEADYAVYLCNSYSVEQRCQSEDRIYRGQVKTNKNIIDIICKGTCENRVTEALKQGKELLDTGTTDTEIFKYYGD